MQIGKDKHFAETHTGLHHPLNLLCSTNATIKTLNWHQCLILKKYLSWSHTFTLRRRSKHIKVLVCLLENLKNKPKTHVMHFKLHTQFNSLFLRNEVTSAFSEDTIISILKWVWLRHVISTGQPYCHSWLTHSGTHTHRGWGQNIETPPIFTLSERDATRGLSATTSLAELCI